MPAIRTDDLRKAYGDVTALDGLSLSVEPGALYGLLGPNGAGKTTTMELLTGQIVPDAGEATVLGVDPAVEPVGVRELVGILPEKESPPSFLTPREYLQFVGAVRGLDDETVDTRTTAWADRLGFAGKLDTLATDLSRGQQQKTMIAGAFLHEPDLVFIDEPLANLDPLVQERVKRFLREYREAGNTVVVSTHNVEVAAELCSQVGIVSAGSLVAEVVPADLGPETSLLDAFMEHVEAGGEADRLADAAAAEANRSGEETAAGRDGLAGDSAPEADGR
ncbi:MAG: ABC transporter ATP-binding protein [Halolamina sp.]